MRGFPAPRTVPCDRWRKIHRRRKTAAAARLAAADRPLHRRHRIERLAGERVQCADVEIAAAAILEGRERGVFAEHIRFRCEIECGGEAEPPRDLARRSTNPAWFRPAAPGMRAAARCAVPNWSPCPISRPRPAPAAAPARRHSRCRWSAHSPRRRTVRASRARRVRHRHPAATPPGWCPSPTTP